LVYSFSLQSLGILTVCQAFLLVAGCGFVALCCGLNTDYLVVLILFFGTIINNVVILAKWMRGFTAGDVGEKNRLLTELKWNKWAGGNCSFR